MVIRLDIEDTNGVRYTRTVDKFKVQNDFVYMYEINKHEGSEVARLEGTYLVEVIRFNKLRIEREP